MKKSLLALAAVLALSSAAAAADMPVKTKAVEYVDTWNGFYWGLNAGVAWTRDVSLTPTPDANTLAFFNTAPADPLPNTIIARGNGGAIFGFTAGYNWQISNVVLGIETDFQKAAVHARGVEVLPRVAVPGTNAFPFGEADLSWLGTLRARLGVLATPSFLLYGTGGLAYGVVAQRWAYFNVAANGAVGRQSGPAGDSNISVGWTAGVGFEWMIMRNVTLGAEYLYVNLRSGKTMATGLPNGGCGTGVPTNFCNFSVQTTDQNSQIARVKLNFLFGGGPVVAKY